MGPENLPFAEFIFAFPDFFLEFIDSDDNDNDDDDEKSPLVCTICFGMHHWHSVHFSI